MIIKTESLTKHYQVGSEKVEVALKGHIPEATIDRLDAETAVKKGQLVAKIENCRNFRADWIVRRLTITAVHNRRQKPTCALASLDTRG